MPNPNPPSLLDAARPVAVESLCVLCPVCGREETLEYGGNGEDYESWLDSVSRYNSADCLANGGNHGRS